MTSVIYAEEQRRTVRRAILAVLNKGLGSPDSRDIWTWLVGTEQEVTGLRSFARLSSSRIYRELTSGCARLEKCHLWLFLSLVTRLISYLSPFLPLLNAQWVKCSTHFKIFLKIIKCREILKCLKHQDRVLKMNQKSLSTFFWFLLKIQVCGDG